LEDIEKARKAIPDEQNGALIVTAAIKEIPAGWAKDRYGNNSLTTRWRFDCPMTR